MDILIKNKARGIYLLPNIFTTGCLFAGFYSIIASMKGLYDIASSAIFIAIVADALDGRIARLTHTQTAFGAEYDSLADMVSFGIAPAILAYQWALMYFGKLGWLAAFLFTASVALRLARFNTQAGMGDRRYFQGLPCPSGAAIVAGFIWVNIDYQYTSMFIHILLLSLSLIAAALMVSNIRYYSFKQFTLKDHVPFISLFALVLIFIGISIAPAQVLWGSFLLYAFSGPFLTLWGLRKNRLLRKKAHSE